MINRRLRLCLVGPLISCPALPVCAGRILALPPISGSRPLTLTLPSDGRGDSDWMITVICKRVERDTASGGSEIGVRMRPFAPEVRITACIIAVLEGGCFVRILKTIARVTWLIIFMSFTLVSRADPHNWNLKGGKAIYGDYVSSGPTNLVLVHGGSNVVVAISNLATNEFPFFLKCQIAQRQAHLDAETNQMIKAGKIEFSSDLLDKSPEKVENKSGWMDGEYDGLKNDMVESKRDELGVFVHDKNNDMVANVVAFKTNLNGVPMPVIADLQKLKRGDKFRMFGTAASDGLKDNQIRLYIDRIEIIETKAEADLIAQADQNSCAGLK